MRSVLIRATTIWLLAFNVTLNAQSTTNTPPSDPQLERERRMISFLTPPQQEQYAKARAKALADNPKVKAEGDALIAQVNSVMTEGTPADRQAFLDKMNSHRQMLRQAMLKEDGALGPIFAEIDKHISELKARQTQQAGNPASPH